MKEKLTIVKVGGKVLSDDSLLASMLKDFTSIDGKKILIHGGGDHATKVAKRMGVASQMIDGRRVTDLSNLEVIVMSYAGWLNKMIVSRLQAAGTNALGVSGADLDLVKAERRNHPTIDFGEVGDVNEHGINTPAIRNLLDQGILPVFCSVTHDGKGHLLNTNADTIASEIAVAMVPHFEVELNFCFEFKGVLRDKEDQESWIKRLNFGRYRQMVDGGQVSEGMLPKLDNAFQVLRRNVATVIIKNAGSLKSSEGTILYLDRATIDQGK